MSFFSMVFLNNIQGNQGRKAPLWSYEPYIAWGTKKALASPKQGFKFKKIIIKKYIQYEKENKHITNVQYLYIK